MREDFNNHANALQRLIYITLIIGLYTFGQSQSTYHVRIDAAEEAGQIKPLWNDYWELNVQHGYGPHAGIFRDAPHTPFIEDPGFVETMELLKPRSIKVSTGSFVYLPHINYASEDTAVLKVLPTEFYRGPNTLEGADNPEFYHFDFLDKQLNALEDIGVTPFLNFDYMPFVLASNKIPKYHVGTLLSLWHFDNEIRTAPPADNRVFARVVKNVIRHVLGLFKGNKDYGIEYVEIWNEPDHQLLPLNFWSGDEYALYEMYEAISVEVEDDPEISTRIKLGCCSFAIQNESQETFVRNFLVEAKNNNTRLDFLSVHPYSSDPFRSLDPQKLSTAQNLIDMYIPGAELVNAEWGILSLTAGTFRNSLEHDLYNMLDVVTMLDMNVSFAHYVHLVDYEPNSANSGAVCTNNPILPRVTAIVRANMNKLLETPLRLKVESTDGGSAISGLDSSRSKIVISVPAIRPESDKSNTYNITVNNIPFEGNYKVTIFELTQSDYANGDYFKIKDQYLADKSDLTLQLIYQEDSGYGRLFTIVLEQQDTTSSISEISHPVNKLTWNPNPAQDVIEIAVRNEFSSSMKSVNIFDPIGRKVVEQDLGNAHKTTIDLRHLTPGLYVVVVALSSGDAVFRIIKD